MIEQLKPLLMQKVAGELADRFGLSESMIETVVDKVVEVAAGLLGGGSQGGGGNLAGLMSMGQQLLGGGNADMVESLLGGLKDQLPAKLAETGQLDASTAGNITEALLPKVKELAGEFLGGDRNAEGGLLGKLGDLF